MAISLVTDNFPALEYGPNYYTEGMSVLDGYANNFTIIQSSINGLFDGSLLEAGSLVTSHYTDGSITYQKIDYDGVLNEGDTLVFNAALGKMQAQNIAGVVAGDTFQVKMNELDTEEFLEDKIPHILVLAPADNDLLINTHFTENQRGHTSRILTNNEYCEDMWVAEGTTEYALDSQNNLTITSGILKQKNDDILAQNNKPFTLQVLEGSGTFEGLGLSSTSLSASGTASATWTCNVAGDDFFKITNASGLKIKKLAPEPVPTEAVPVDITKNQNRCFRYYLKIPWTGGQLRVLADSVVFDGANNFEGRVITPVRMRDGVNVVKAGIIYLQATTWSYLVVSFSPTTYVGPNCVYIRGNTSTGQPYVAPGPVNLVMDSESPVLFELDARYS